MTHSKLYKWFHRPQTLDEFIDKVMKNGVDELYITPYVFFGVPSREGLHYAAGVAVNGVTKKIKYKHMFGESVGINPFDPVRNNKEFHLEVIRYLKEKTAEEAQKVADTLQNSGIETQMKDFVLEVIGGGLHGNRFGTLELDGNIKGIPKPETI